MVWYYLAMKKASEKGVLTKRQFDLLSVIYNYLKDSGYPPTFEEMRLNFGVSSNQSVLDHLTQLEKRGAIKRSESSARGIAILPLGYELLGRPFLTPFLGFTSAGSPIEAIEISGEWQTMSRDVAKLSGEVFLLKIAGHSMINAGIDDGDVVLVQSQKEFVSGDIVLARIGDESTVKRFVSEDKPPYVYLKPENPRYPIQPFNEETRLTGKVISVIKNGHWKPVK